MYVVNVSKRLEKSLKVTLTCDLHLLIVKIPNPNPVFWVFRYINILKKEISSGSKSPAPLHFQSVPQ